MQKKVELLAPAGDMERLKTAIHFGADAVYFAGKKYGLRAFSDNFQEDELKQAVEYAHQHNVKCYITVNIIAHNKDFDGLVEYLKYLDTIHVDAVIVSDLGIASLVKKHTNLELHVSTQASITNSYTANVWASLGAKRLVLARELSLEEIKEIRKNVPNGITLECFIHGAMCISYSGRCLLSNYFVNRDSNQGACVQACRWEYELSYKDNKGDTYPVKQDERGTYVFNSKDMCLINHLKKLIDAGISSFKIEGRMKTPYYVATVVNAYKRALANIYGNKKDDFDYITELQKTSHRHFSTGFYFPDEETEYTLSSKAVQSHQFVAVVKEKLNNNEALIELRNKIVIGDELEILSPTDNWNKVIKVIKLIHKDLGPLEEANRVQDLYIINDEIGLKVDDILRKKIDD